MQPVWTYLFGAVCAGLFVLAFAGGGAYLIYRSVSSRQKAGQSQSWPTAMGQVTRSELDRSDNRDADGDTTTTFTPLVEYDYDVLGRMYHGKRIDFGPPTGHSNPAKAQSVLARYPIGSNVQVHYNPDDPNEAVLEQKSSSSTVLLVIGILLLVMACCIASSGLAVALINML